MTEDRSAAGRERRGWHSGNIWARSEEFGGNPVKQLLVPESDFSTVAGGEALEVANNYGVWPAASSESPIVQEVVWLALPPGTRVGDSLTSASWRRPKVVTRSDPADVVESYRNAITFNEGTGDCAGLRSPQLGAVHAVLGYWTTKRDTPATVVMPTGTGKTETMLALLVAGRLTRLLVLVPSDALREQVATKFETLGVLQELGIVTNTALRPVVGRIQKGFTSADVAGSFARACNVIVATPQALTACDPDARDAVAGACTHLFVDEAHHVAARTWSDVRDLFVRKPVVQFTATPFREDGRHLQGRSIYSFPLREAQAQGYFSYVDYTAVIDFENLDRAVAAQSIAKLRADLAAGLDHVLMARVGSISRAKNIKPLYDELAADLSPVIVYSQMPKKQQREAVAALREGRSRVVVCVDMLGEGFDLPSLKIAAVHDPQKSLGVTLQFIGRFARTSATGRYGAASIFVARREIEVDGRLRELYAEDSDWNLILRNLTEAVVQGQHEVSDFEDGFTSLPEEVAMRSLLPKLSTVVYRARTDNWEPQNVVDFFGDRLYTEPIGLNLEAGVAWFVVKNRGDVSWGDLKTIEEVTFELYLLYFDRDKRLLYINNSANSGVFEDLAEAVLGPDPARFTGSTVYRVMADISRLVPTTVGVLDAHDRFRRFSMHVGSDVTASFSQAEASTKSQTNISGGGYRDGEQVTISASLKGRIWSTAIARGIMHWCDWCDSVGQKLLDDTISIDQVIGQFLLPERLTDRPAGVVLAMEWPWQIHTAQAANLRLSFKDLAYEAAYTDLIPDTTVTDNLFRFDVRTKGWTVTYEAVVENGRLRYRCTTDDEIKAVRARSELKLSDWLNEMGLTFLLDDDRLIEDDLLLQPNRSRPPYDREKLTPLNWAGTTITVESQTKDRLTHSIQYRAITELKAEAQPWDLIIDDDGSGEIADIVAMRVDNEGLLIRLVHCKYSHADAPGTRVEDMYEVCGQAQKSVRWRRGDLRWFFRTLNDRAQKKQQREAVSPFEVGDPHALYRIQEQATVLPRRMEMVIVQPGLSASRATPQQLDVLASTQAYLLTTINAPLAVWCSS
ncbi:DEAD/DEAH box helicase family protein [Actinoplanes sp. TBRC 11911]|uniref:DEAD/DEAH box helicase n=1 Tax=Actinoplanes sp. TBRC 11911 TaxID=2729386 RepID=UPI00145DFC3E|nr:DEAD/DEAH box helicase family protein [Actinoplanes sp. TBRC 11911]NMO53415.1 DEAD/DEAH box helicase family protein [Actinoplanes sp. TBRC 11911]